ncbi:hypothetical protein Tco_0403368, partial [Tanacetum coccineum]
IVYNDALTSKLDFLTEPIVSPQHINEFNLKNKTSLSECSEEEQNVIYFNDLFPFNVIDPDDLKSYKDNDNDEIDIKQSSGDNVINTDVGAYAQGSNKLLETSHDTITEIHAETPTIPYVVPTLSHTSPFMYTDSSDSNTSDRPPSQDSSEVTIARWRSRVASRSSPPSSTTHVLSPTNVTPPTLRRILPAPPGLPRRPTVLVLPGRLASRYLPDHSSLDHFSSDDSSSDSSYDSSSDYSSDSSSGHSLPDSSVDAPATRCRSPAMSVLLAIPVPGSLSPIRADLLPPRKRIKGVITASDYDDSTKESYEVYTEPNIDSNVQADIDADTVAVEAAAAREADIGVKGRRMLAATEKRAGMFDRIMMLERDNMRLRGMLTMPTATRTGMTPFVIEEMIERRGAEALEAYEANRNRRPTMESVNECEDGNEDGGNGNGNPDMNVEGLMPVARE